METLKNIATVADKEYLKFVHELHKVLLKKDIILVYEGEVDQSITKAFTSLVERHLSGTDQSFTLKKRVYHVIVECLQNICKHSDNMLTGESLSPGEGVFVVARDEENYLVISGNAVYKDRMEDLIEQINYINSLDLPELKKYYKVQLKESRLSQKAGAGLGLIDIAKKTERKIQFIVEPVNDQVDFFIMKLTIPLSIGDNSSND
ncbi:SiaB family protein kinase [Paracrocinitomix mangrovi]|uniref:SiaB family protein kinase n=1 Tax=Paracrocinitomix mangrovi TaxID=2862509 RepID=UPI001C8CF4DB|nr:SiaB family protein kinase [Paracrocinitomix mangrovi]UKN01616.1 SiaB family protein kinase [Paracrocinitomix mangrovi]